MKYPNYDYLEPIDKLERCIAKDIVHTISSCTDMRDRYNLRVTAEINEQYLAVEVRLETCSFVLPCDNIHTVVSKILNLQGFGHNVVKLNYRFENGAHYWDTLVKLTKHPTIRPSQHPMIHNDDFSCHHKHSCSCQHKNHDCGCHKHSCSHKRNPYRWCLSDC